MIDLTSLIGTYTPLTDPVTGQVINSISGVDFGFIFRGILLVICVSSIFMILINLIRSFGRR
jgi:hypothetical protein